MKTRTIISTFDLNTDEGKRANWRLINAKDTHRMQDAVGMTLTVKAYTLFERDYETGEEPVKVIYIVTPDGIFATASKSFISGIETFVDAGFSPETIDEIKVIAVTSKNGRRYLVADFD